MDQGTGLQSFKRRRVTLAGNVHNVSNLPSAVVIGDCVSDLTIGRSGLLQGVEETDGFAPLPPHLSSADFRLWETAQFVEQDFPLDDLVTVAKVADALGDANVKSWLNKISSLLPDGLKLLGRSGDPNVCSILRLPPHLRHPVLADALEISGASARQNRSTLSRSLQYFPAALHRDIVAAAARSGELAFGHSDADKVLLSLSAISVPSPGLLAVKIFPPEESETESSAACSRPSTGGSLAHALSAHPSLTSLTLTAPAFPPQWLRCFSNCLPVAAAPHLASLSISIEGHPGGCAALAACLCHLSSLTSLSVTANLPKQKGPASAGARECLSRYSALAASSASLPHLVELSFTEAAVRDAFVPQFWGPDEHFRRLDVSAHPSSAHTLFSVISAPAASRLSLALHTARLPLDTLLRQLRRFPALVALDITATVLASSTQLWSLRSSQIAQPSAMRDLHVCSSCTVSGAAMTAAAAQLGASSLTGIELGLFLADAGAPPQPQNGVGTCTEVAHARALLNTTLQSCSRVRRLDLQRALCGFNRHDPSQPLLSAELCSVMSALTQLTALGLGAAPNQAVMLEGHAFGAALSGLQALEWLSLGGDVGEFGFDNVRPVMAVCAAHGQITYLQLHFHGVTEQLVINTVPSMAALRCLNLKKSVFGDAYGEHSAGIAQADALRARVPNVEIGID